MWPLRCGGSAAVSTRDNTLVLSFVEQTRVLTLCGEEVEETEIPGFVSDQQTFYTGNTEHNQVVQVTPGSVRLVSPDSKQMIDEWRPPGGKVISICGYNQTKVVVAAGPVFFYIEMHQGIGAL